MAFQSEDGDLVPLARRSDDSIVLPGHPYNDEIDITVNDHKLFYNQIDDIGAKRIKLQSLSLGSSISQPPTSWTKTEEFIPSVPLWQFKPRSGHVKRRQQLEAALGPIATRITPVTEKGMRQIVELRSVQWEAQNRLEQLTEFERGPLLALFLTEALVDAPRSRLFELLAGGRPVAWSLVLYFQDPWFYLTCYDTTSTRFSPGRILLHEIAQHYASTANYLHLGRGLQPYKTQLSDHYELRSVTENSTSRDR